VPLSPNSLTKFTSAGQIEKAPAVASNELSSIGLLVFMLLSSARSFGLGDGFRKGVFPLPDLKKDLKPRGLKSFYAALFLNVIHS
jgi:predicted RecA/RadA family phage recombinase